MMTHLKPSRYVLYIDDEAMAVKNFQDFFDSEFPILTATTIQDAWKVIHERGQEIAIIISDERMPTGSGIELLSEVNQQYPDIIRILTTAYASLDNSLLAINQGRIYAYITKPWNLDHIRTTLHSAYREFDKRQAFLAVASSIAHEMRTPLSIINVYAMQIASVVPELQKSYGLAVLQELMQDTVNPKFMKRLPHMAETLQKEIARAHTIIDLMLASTRAIDPKDFSTLSMTVCVHEALERYPFAENERQLVHTQLGHGFSFLGLSDMFIFVLFNLLKNSLWAIKEANKGVITISTFETKHHHVLQFQDTGPGIPADVLPRIFGDFYSTKKSSGGTGVGLAFCQRVMRAFGADIRCESVHGEYTSFWMAFAKV